jgi:hypothetical protein
MLGMVTGIPVQGIPCSACWMEHVKVVRAAGIAVAMGSRSPSPPSNAGKWMIAGIVVWSGRTAHFVKEVTASWMMMCSCSVVGECHWLM